MYSAVLKILEGRKEEMSSAERGTVGGFFALEDEGPAAGADELPMAAYEEDGMVIILLLFAAAAIVCTL
jgi:hypothetical protein